jgi:hypothetical protein
LTGSSPTPKTIGIVAVAALAASAAGLLPGVAITATRRHERRQALILTLQPVVFDRCILAFDDAGLVEPFAECSDIARWDIAAAADKPDNRHRRLLRAHRGRRGPAGAAGDGRAKL